MALPRLLNEAERRNYLGALPVGRCWTFRCGVQGEAVQTSAAGHRGVYCPEHAADNAARHARRAARYAECGAL